MSKQSDATTVLSINTTDLVLLVRPLGGGLYSSIKIESDDFVSSLLTAIGNGTITWASLDKTGSSLADLATKSHTALTDKGTNTHAQIDAFMAAHASSKIVTFAPIESEFDCKIRDGTIAFTAPPLLDGYNLTGVICSVGTPGSGTGATGIQIRRRRSGTDADMLGTRVTLVADDYYSQNGVVNTSYDDIITGDQIYADCKTLTSTPPKGLSVSLTFNIP